MNVHKRRLVFVVAAAALAVLVVAVPASATTNAAPVLAEITNVRVGADALNVQAFVSETKTFDAFATDPDAGAALTYSLPVLISPSDQSVPLTALGVSIVNTVDSLGRAVGRVTIAPDSADVDVWQLQVRVDDGAGGNDQHRIFVSVGTFTNQSPVFSTAPPAEAVAAAGEEITFSMSTSDPNCGQLVTLTVVDQPTGSTFSSGTGNPVSRTFSWTPTAGQTGDYTVFFDATDNGSPAVTERIRTTIHVAPTLPTADADGDGVPDASDNCPAVANPDQADGDFDGTGDACDPQFNSTPCVVKGLGFLATPAQSFAFAASFATGAPKPKGALGYLDLAAKTFLKSGSITGLACRGGEATLVGTGTVKGGAVVDFTVGLVDNGTPGAGADRFSIRWAGYAKAGTLGGGNVAVDPA